ncbi:hypothetical protein GCM10011584_22310 [Nocardioides phosphati]|uniref:Class F sortase n=1 Tax=Nocardioides phosphati TaxID=1867775 RepID=A0ABQ2NBP2_9ACTN|nr:class F sortase [Nocardioides phosphati]GGO90469.1 hypothetical protein GCM10011584_22310 [Nocardioides phosphati]
MTPTLAGRVQTRLALALVPGVPVALAAAGLLDHLTLGRALIGLLVITVLGLVWDAAYQALQDRRWDRDWPPLLTLLSWVPEACASWLALNALGSAAPRGTHLVFFTLLWSAALLVRAAVLPVLLPHWRHEGQRLVVARARAAIPAPARAPEATTTAEEPAAEEAPARSRGFSLGALGLRPGTPRFATVALFVGVFGAVLLLAPLLGHDTPPPAADPRLTHGEEHQAMKVERVRRLHAWDTTKRVLPAYVEFPAAGVDTRLGMTLMKENGVLVTPDPRHAAWYGQGAAPGQRGPAVVIGSTDAIFQGLAHAKAGQQLRVVRTDGSRVAFTVDRVMTVDARAFPTQEVYGATRRPLLRLVGYDAESGRNTIVFAHAAWVTAAPMED